MLTGAPGISRLPKALLALPDNLTLPDGSGQ